LISSRTVLCGILLHPAAHTRSPAMHNAAFAALGIDAVYLAFDVPPARLEAAVAGCRSLGVRQLAISLPHKERVLALADRVDPDARAIGAANTLTLEGSAFVASNTDWIGLVRALERAGALAGCQAVVLGAGGAARAAVFGLRERGARVVVLNRTVSRAQNLAADLGAERAGPLEALRDIPYDVLVNTTSVGLTRDASPVAAEALRPGTRVLDAVYAGSRTRLLRQAAARGARPIEGKWMLIEQALEQLRLWTGKEAPREVLEAAFDAAT